MKYFTPDLYRAGNTTTSEIYDDFDAVWEDKINTYRSYLKRISRRVPVELMRLASKICLHDAEILSYSKSAITVWKQGELISVEFDLDPGKPQPKSGPAIPGHPFDTSGHCWMYEELEELEPGVFLFEVLISNGKILRFRCRDVVIWEIAERTQPTGHSASKGNGKVHPPLTLPKLRELVAGKTRKSGRPSRTRATAK